MRVPFELAIALGLSLVLEGVCHPQQDPVASTKSQKTDASTAPAASAKRRKSTSTKAPAGGPKRIVVREGGATEPAEQIAPGMSPAEAIKQRQNAQQWLGSTDEQLKQLAGKKLDVSQQQAMSQIHNYVDGARSALQEGDVRRASTLAEKAHLLAEDLLSH